MAWTGRTQRLRDAAKAFEAAHTPLDALAAAKLVREAADDLEREAVAAARADGASWLRIGAVYQLTKQGAQQRFKARRAESPEEPAASD